MTCITLGLWALLFAISLTLALQLPGIEDSASVIGMTITMLLLSLITTMTLTDIAIDFYTNVYKPWANRRAQKRRAEHFLTTRQTLRYWREQGFKAAIGARPETMPTYTDPTECHLAFQQGLRMGRKTPQEEAEAISLVLKTAA